MWRAVGETTGIYEKFCIERRPRYGVTVAHEKLVPDSQFISDPTALPLFPSAC